VIYDFAGIGLPGLLFTGSATLSDNAINPANGAALARINEYDFDLIYQVAARTAPDWLKPLQLRARAAYVDQFLNGTLTSIEEYRLILNYEISFSGGR
jgi:hypothetical protein